MSTAPHTSHFRELNNAELDALHSLQRKAAFVLRGPGVPEKLAVTYRFQRDGFCVCIIRGEAHNSKRKNNPVTVIWTGVSKRAPSDPHNEIRGKMLAFVRAAQATPAIW